MNILIIILSLFLLSHVTLGQTKIDEYARADSDSEGARLDNFLMDLSKAPESTGVIVVYTGDDNRGLANALRDIDGIKRWIAIRNEEASERVTFQLLEKGPQLFKELWVYPKGTSPPASNLKDIDLGDLKEKFLWASICASCDPAIGQLSKDVLNLKLYADILKRYPKYEVMIVVHPASYSGWTKRDLQRDAIEYVTEYKTALNALGIQNRLRITIGRPVIKRDAPVMMAFYILPPSVAKRQIK